jgi:hypothetical protein
LRNGWHTAQALAASLDLEALGVYGAEEPVLYLRSLELSEFRAFGRAILDFPKAGVVAIAGANNTGKSALLSVLDVVRGSYGSVAC